MLSALNQAAFLAGPNFYCHRSCVLIDGQYDVCSAAVPDTLGPVPHAFFEGAWRDALASRASLPTALLHVALALQAESAVCPPTSARVLGLSGNRVAVVLESEDPEIGLAAWQAAVESFPLAVAGDATALQSCFERFRKAAVAHGPDQMTRALLRAAAARGIPWYRLNPGHGMMQVGQGARGRRLHATVLESTSVTALNLSASKALTTRLLQRLGYPVPDQHEASGFDEALRAAAQIGYPVVVKPCHGHGGRAVSVGVPDAEALRQAFLDAERAGDSVIVESVVAGQDHRLLVVNGRLIAAAMRRPAQVTGDGISSIESLVAVLNRDIRRGRDETMLMEIIDLDREALEMLAAQGLEPRSVLPEGKVALLRRTANVSRGGDAVDVTDRVHPDNVRLAEEVARVIGLDVTGIDFMTPDITRSWREVGGAIIEVNAEPGLRPHWLGGGRDVAGPILDRLIPEGDGRIPTVGITGSLGKTTTARMVAHILAAAGKHVGLATTQGTEIGGRGMREGDCAGGISAVNLLLHPDVDAGVFELARGGLIKHGMVLDRIDVGAVLNVHDNHLGLEGVTRREELAAVKQLVVSNATECAVLNADDPLCLAMRTQVRSRRVCLVGRDAGGTAMSGHRRAGGETVVLHGEDGSAVIVASSGERELGRIEVSRIPATLGGIAMAKAENASFALAIALGLGLPFELARRSLEQFESTVEGNPGRLNLIRGEWPFAVLLDWADGPVALAELARVSAQLPIAGRRLLVTAAVGNRSDDFIRAGAESLAGTFDRYYCVNHHDLRGRRSDEVPALLRSGLLCRGVADSAIRLGSTLEEGLGLALSDAAPGDLLVVDCFDESNAVLERIRRWMSGRPAVGLS